MATNTKKEERITSGLNEKQTTAFNNCLKTLKGLSFYEAERVLYALMDATKRKAILN